MYTVAQIVKILDAKYIGVSDDFISSLIFDSRMIIPSSGSLFFALKSANNDGHRYIADVYKKGVRNFVVNSQFFDFSNFPDANFIIVHNTIASLQHLAAYHRSLFDIPIFAVTGSNGKTIVKEWLAYFLNKEKKTLKSPKSYNSQIGVALSVWELSDIFELAVFEAGISKPHEMDNLQKIINPSIALFTNIGDAHQENFTDLKSKVYEKLELFKDASLCIYSADYEIIDRAFAERLPEKKTFTWSLERDADLRMLDISSLEDKHFMRVLYRQKEYLLQIKYIDKASIENTMSVLSALLCFYGNRDPLSFDFSELPEVEMRLQQIEGKNNCTIINDSYNCDLASLKIALDVLTAQNQNTKKTVILSDIYEVGKDDNDLYARVAQMLENIELYRIIGIGETIAAYSDAFEGLKFFYKSTDDFLLDLQNLNFFDEAILLKGARKFNFEHIADVLQLKNHRTVLEINMTAFEHNLQYFRSLLKPKTKLMVMVKAFSYGSGSYEIANFLQRKGVDYLAVAIADEGIALRKAGIFLPILILNPDVANFDLFVEYTLEPEIYSFRMLDAFYEAVKNKVYNTYPIHLKFNTGMNRLGFEQQDIDLLCEKLFVYNKIFVKSVFSHLVGSDDEQFDDFSIEQANMFVSITDKLEHKLGYKFLRHLLNSAGIERFGHLQFSMVRLGIGLYGISALNEHLVQSISSLKTKIIKIFEVKKGQTVGYSRAWKAHRDSIIATLPIGYADGLDRRLSNAVGKVFVNGKSAPIVGNICMDLTMIDITDIDASETDEVVIFGQEQSISDIAQLLNTIAYEVLTSISHRVKRVYVWE